jgi:taurine dioxygenase
VGALPPTGGATAFASTVAGYDSLAPAEQAAAEKLDAVHSWCDFMRFLEGRDPDRPKASAAQCAARPDVIWPLVRTHPITGRKGLFLNPKNALRVIPRGGEDATAAGADMDGSCALPTVHSPAAAPPNKPCSSSPPLAGWSPLSPSAAAGDLVLNLTKRVLLTGVYSHQWAPGDLVLFDNRVLMHAATPFNASAHERLLFRAEFSGEPVYLY